MTMTSDSAVTAPASGPYAVDGDYGDSEAVRQAKLREAQKEKIRALGIRLKADFDQRVTNRMGVERRWIEDLRLYNSEYDPEVLRNIKANGGSEVFLSIARTKTDAVEAHHSNLLLPTDERNWEITPSPVPEMAPLEGSNAEIHRTPEGQPVTASDLADGMRKAIAEACDKMRATIEDQLVECDYAQVVRKTLHQGCVLGTGVMRGPVLKNKKKKRWAHAPGSMPGNTVWQKQGVMERDRRPAIENVNVWDFYPADGIGDILQSDGEYVRHWLTRSQVRELQFDVDFFREEIADLLRNNPEAPKVTNHILLELRQLSGELGIMQTSFEMIEFVGMVDSAELIACGIEVPDDALDAYKASIFMIDGIPVKAALELMEDCVEKEFFVWQLAKDDTSIWGKGTPRLMRTSVLMANAVNRMMMDNAGLSVGGQLVYKPKEITPADGNPRLKPRGVWYHTGDGPIAEAFRIEQIPPQIEWLMPIWNMAIRLCDDESALPMIAQGDQAAHVTKTKGGMSMLMDAAGVMLRRSVKGFDDNITIPMVEAMYSWNMLYNPDDTIKGDFSPKARGSSALLEREQQMEAFTQFIQFLNSNPLFQKVANWPAVLEEGARLLRINRAALLLPQSKIEEIVTQMQQNPQQPPEDPRVTAAKLMVQASIQNAETTAQATIGVAQIKAGVQMHELDATLQKLSAELDITRESLDKKLGIDRIRLDQEAQRFNAEQAFHAATGEAVA